MLIYFYWLLKNLLLPSFLGLIIEPLLLIVIIIVGIALALGCVGIKFKGSLSKSIVDNIFKGIGYICRLLAKGFWRICKFFYFLTPKLFKMVKQFCIQKGISLPLSNLLASLVTIIFLIVLI